MLCLSSILFMASFNMIIPELNNYITRLGAPDLKGYNILLFGLAALLVRPVSGKLAENIGRIPVMVIGCLVGIISGLAYPVLNFLAGYLALRFFHGFSSGFKPIGTTAYLADITPQHRRGEALGYLGMSGSLGMAGGPYIGSLIAREYSLNTMFIASAVVALLSLMVIVGMDESLKGRKPFEWSMLRISRKEIIYRKVWAPSTYMFMTIFSFGIILVLIPDLSDHLGIENRGLFFFYMLLMSIVTRMFAGRASDKWGRVLILKAGALLLATGMFLAGISETKEMFIAAAIITGISAGVNSPTVFAWTIDLSSDKSRGPAMSTMFIALELGIIFSSYFANFMYQNDPSMFMPTFWVGSGMSLVAFAFLFLYKKRMR